MKRKKNSDPAPPGPSSEAAEHWSIVWAAAGGARGIDIGEGPPERRAESLHYPAAPLFSFYNGTQQRPLWPLTRVVLQVQWGGGLPYVMGCFLYWDCYYSVYLLYFINL